jgi:hypothetical protein
MIHAACVNTLLNLAGVLTYPLPKGRCDVLIDNFMYLGGGTWSDLAAPSGRNFGFSGSEAGLTEILTGRFF